MRIAIADSDADILACFDVMHELRPHLVLDRFVDDVRRLQREGFILAALRDDADRVVAVAGYRYYEKLATGPQCYLDDLVTAPDVRSHGYGKALLAWLQDEAAKRGCRYLELDSAHVRKDAHRFYHREGYDDVGLHFSIPLNGAPRWRANVAKT